MDEVEQSFLELELPERFVIDVPADDGGWIDYGVFERSLFERFEDGSYLCAGHGWSPFYLRCIARHGPLLVVLDGGGERFVYRIRDVSKRRVLNTASGQSVDFEQPDPQTIELEDIAGALSRICRFGGQSREFYSVAQHAVLVQTLVIEAGHPELALLALHHDSHEAYAGDIPTPLKQLFGDLYGDIVKRLDKVIGKALQVDFPPQRAPEWEHIKLADTRALNMEAARLLPVPVDSGIDSDSLPPLDEPLTPEAARLAFVQADKSARELRYPPRD